MKLLFCVKVEREHKCVKESFNMVAVVMYVYMKDELFIGKRKERKLQMEVVFPLLL
jgi:hypothetical protein